MRKEKNFSIGHAANLVGVTKRAIRPLILLLLVTACAAPPAAKSHDDEVVHTAFGAIDPTMQELPELAERAPGHDQPLGPAHVRKLLQLAGPVEPQWRHALESRGGIIEGYVPSHTLIVRFLSKDDAEHALEGLEFVRASVALPRLFKLDPRLVAVTQAGLYLAPRAKAALAFVQLAPKAHIGALLKKVKSLGGRLWHAGHPQIKLDPLVSLGTSTAPSDANATAQPEAEGPEGQTTVAAQTLEVEADNSALLELIEDEDVLAIEPASGVGASNDNTYGIVQSDEPQHAPIWDRGLHGEGQIVAFADTGLATESCFFAGRKKIVGYEDRTDTPDGDATGHGTHVAGTIAGDRYGNGSYDEHDGMAPAATLFAQDVAVGDDFTGVAPDLGPMFDSAYQAGARIHSNSWNGATFRFYDARSRSLDAFVYTHRDFLVLAAAGNLGWMGERTIGAPGAAKNLVTVGATDSLHKDDVAPFSGQGPTFDGRIKPTLLAPGVDISSASSTASCDVTIKSGTSMATPAVAGAAALVRQYLMQVADEEARLTRLPARVPSSALLRAVLLVGAKQLAQPSHAGAATPMMQGFGRLDLARSLADGTGGGLRLIARDEGRELETGQAEVIRLQIPDDGLLDVALAWTDLPAAPMARRALVADLDLSILRESDGAAIALGNASIGEVAPEPDRRNVEEVARLHHLPAGIYQIRIYAHDVPLQAQSFALAILTQGHLAS